MKKYSSINEFIKDLSPENLEIFTLIRSYILESESSLTENIKWNAPNYVFKGEDRITFNVMNKEKKIKVLIHKGAKEKEDKKALPIMKDDSGLITWNSNIRGTLDFNSVEEAEKNHDKLVVIFNSWLKL